MVDWIASNHSWLGYVVMALLGGLTAHILNFEKSPMVDWPWYRHLACIGVAWVKAAFVAVFVYYLAQEYWRVPPPLCFVMSGIGSVFASESIRWFYERGRAMLEARINGRASRD